MRFAIGTHPRWATVSTETVGRVLVGIVHCPLKVMSGHWLTQLSYPTQRDALLSLRKITTWDDGMATRMSLRTMNPDGSASAVAEEKLATEEQIESAVESAPELLGIDVLIVGRQTQSRRWCCQIA